MDFGQYVKRIRESAGLSREYVADRIGVHVSYMGHIENGRNMPTPELMRGLSLALGVPLETLMVKAGYIDPTPATELAERLADREAKLRRIGELAKSIIDLDKPVPVPGASPAIRVPVLGKVPAGPLMEAIEEAEEHFEVAASQLVKC